MEVSKLVQQMKRQKMPVMTLTYTHKVPYSERTKLVSTKDAKAYVSDLFDDCIETRERFILVCVKGSKVVGHYIVSEGGMAHCAVDLRILMQVCLLSGATSFFVAHNHPSGATTASKEDKLLVQEISEMAKFMHIIMLDSLIVTKEETISMADEGLI